MVRAQKVDIRAGWLTAFWIVVRGISVCLGAKSLLAEETAPASGLVAAPLPAAVAQEGLDLFRHDVRRILTGRCLKCHGGETIEAEFDLSSREGLMRGSATGPVVQLDDVQASRLVRVVRHLDEPNMPQNGAKLDDRQIDALVRWIKLGAPYDAPLGNADADPLAWTRQTIDPSSRSFWSLKPLQRVAPPTCESAWARTDVDRFVFAHLEEHKLQPARPADRRCLIRRAYFDLLGLPPPPDEVERFVADRRPTAWPELIERLLASPHYGERWGRHWLDVARFAESHGFEQDYDRPHAYPYRDFVIQALNSDLPYDQFVAWQLAGDEIEPHNPLAMMATGFLGAGVFPTQLTEREFEKARYDELDDIVATMGTAMLGMTIGCARCHDHKYDPIPSADYYRLIANFAMTIRSNVELDLNADANHVAPHPRAPVTVMISSENVKPIPHNADARGFPHFYKETYFLHRGDVSQKEGRAEPGYLQVLMTDDNPLRWQTAPTPGTPTSYRRRALAQWITDIDAGAGNLLARAIANRIWQHHFGRGLAATPNDLGFQGERPTHPELLDWLAAKMIESDWQLKPVHRLLMTSAVYMQSSTYDANNAGIDPDNRFLWRYAPRRLEAEVIRDSILQASRQLDKTMYGPGTLDEAMKRRSIYFTIKRSSLIPMMQIFDAPEPLVSIGGRPATTVAPQALLFMNNPHVRSWSGSLAAELQPLAEHSPSDAIRQAFLRTIAREPTADELARAEQFVIEQAGSYLQDHPKDAQTLALTDFVQALLGLNEFLFVD